MQPTCVTEPRPWKAAVLWVAVLSAFFFVSYGFAISVASRRSHVPSLVFAWEHGIPFLPWTIMPYWSLDLFYGLSLLLCRTRSELSTLVKRLLLAQTIAVAGFLLFPLRFTFARPEVTGLNGWMFDTLAAFDKPFNQAPSLHLSLAVVLWAHYSSLFRGPLLWLIRGCLILAGLSTLTTYQHHFIDLPAGVWVGLFCIVVFPQAKVASGVPSSRKIRSTPLSAAYLTGSVALVSLAVWLGGAAWILLWPAGALLIVAGVYCIGRPELFGKQAGSMGPSMLCLLAPYVVAAWLNSRLWTWRGPAAVEIADGVWLGRFPDRAVRDALGMASLVDLTAELPVDSTGVEYRGVPLLDLVPPSAEQLDKAVEAIDDLRSARPTLVFCALGYSRSAAAVAAWLVSSGRAASVDAAVAILEARRPGVVFGSAHRAHIAECRLRRLVSV